MKHFTVAIIIFFKAVISVEFLTKSATFKQLFQFLVCVYFACIWREKSMIHILSNWNCSTFNPKNTKNTECHGKLNYFLKDWPCLSNAYTLSSLKMVLVWIQNGNFLCRDACCPSACVGFLPQSKHTSVKANCKLSWM